VVDSGISDMFVLAWGELNEVGEAGLSRVRYPFQGVGHVTVNGMQIERNPSSSP